LSTVDVSGVMWRKSSRSGGGNGDNCVEVAAGVEAVAVRDSKNAAGPVLAWEAASWQAFLTQLTP
jgi:hypothetical protein